MESKKTSSKKKSPQQYALEYSKAIKSSDPTIRANAFDMFPAFLSNVNFIMEEYYGIVNEGIKSADNNAKMYFESCNKALDTIRELTNQPEFSPEQKLKLVELVVLIIDKMGKKETEIGERNERIINKTEKVNIFMSVLSGLAPVVQEVAINYFVNRNSK